MWMCISLNNATWIINNWIEQCGSQSVQRDYELSSVKDMASLIFYCRS